MRGGGVREKLKRRYERGVGEGGDLSLKMADLTGRHSRAPSHSPSSGPGRPSPSWLPADCCLKGRQLNFGRTFDISTF